MEVAIKTCQEKLTDELKRLFLQVCVTTTTLLHPSKPIFSPDLTPIVLKYQEYPHLPHSFTLTLLFPKSQLLLHLHPRKYFFVYSTHIELFLLHWSLLTLIVDHLIMIFAYRKRVYFAATTTPTSFNLSELRPSGNPSWLSWSMFKVCSL